MVRCLSPRNWNQSHSRTTSADRHHRHALDVNKPPPLTPPRYLLLHVQQGLPVRLQHGVEARAEGPQVAAVEARLVGVVLLRDQDDHTVRGRRGGVPNNNSASCVQLVHLSRSFWLGQIKIHHHCDSGCNSPSIRTDTAVVHASIARKKLLIA